MKLDEYLTKNDISTASFAEKIGLSRSYVGRLRKGERRADIDTIEKIESATAGQVTAQDFFSGRTEAA